MIPVQQVSNLNVADLPARASYVSAKDTLDVFGGRRTTWQCSGIWNGKVTIWWGHKSGDARWACNKKYPGRCKGRCRAYKISG